MIKEFEAEFEAKIEKNIYNICNWVTHTNPSKQIRIKMLIRAREKAKIGSFSCKF